MNSLQHFVPPDQTPGILDTDNSLIFISACEDLCWNHDKSTPYRSETNGIAEHAVRRVKEASSAGSVGSFRIVVVGRDDGKLLFRAKHTSVTV